MTPETLTRALEQSTSNDEWVAAVAAWFDAHELDYGHGTDNARDEAYWLLRHLQGFDDARWEAAADPALIGRVVALAERRVRERKPLAYLLNEAWFAGYRFYVDERVLVPRSPFAELIMRRFEPWIALRPGDRVLEVGTGSGCLAIATALWCPEVQVDATDVSADALEVAAANVAAHGVAARVRLHLADLFPSDAPAYRVIISNPPYVPAREYEGLPAEYHHEPKLGLVGGETGLEPAWRLLAQAASHLTDDGVLIVEVGNGAEELDRRVPALGLVWLEFEHGGEGVFLVTAGQLKAYMRQHGFPPDDRS